MFFPKIVLSPTYAFLNGSLIYYMRHYMHKPYNYGPYNAWRLRKVHVASFLIGGQIDSNILMSQRENKNPSIFKIFIRGDGVGGSVAT